MTTQKLQALVNRVELAEKERASERSGLGVSDSVVERIRDALVVERASLRERRLSPLHEFDAGIVPSGNVE